MMLRDEPLHPMTRSEYGAEIRALEDENERLTEALRACREELEVAGIEVQANRTAAGHLNSVIDEVAQILGVDAETKDVEALYARAKQLREELARVKEVTSSLIRDSAPCPACGEPLRIVPTRARREGPGGSPT